MNPPSNWAPTHLHIAMKSLLSVLALSALATAQTPVVSASLHTAAALGVNANRATDAARAGVDASAGLSLSAVDARVAMSNSKAGLGKGPSAVFGWNAHAEGGNLAGTLGSSPIGLGAGPQEYAFGLKARTTVKGKIVIEFSGKASNGGASASIKHGGVAIAFRADGTVQKKVIPGVSVDSNGLRVGVSIAGKADARNSRTASNYAAKLSVSFVPDSGTGAGCSVAPHQKSCRAGGVLQGKVSPTAIGGATLSMDLQGALPSALGVAFVSPTGRSFPIQNSGCIFFRTAIIAQTFKTDAAGNARTAVHFPMIPGAAFYIHEASVLVGGARFKLATSNSLVVKCR